MATHLLAGTRLRNEIEEMLQSVANHETRGTYLRSLREFLRWHTADGRFRFTVEDVKRYKRYLERRKFTRASVSTYITALRKLCAHFVSKGMLKENPAAHITVRQPPRKHAGRPLTDAEIQLLETSLDVPGELGLRDRAIVALMMRNGLSETAIVSLNLEDVRPEGKQWHVGKNVKYLIRDTPTVTALEAYYEWRVRQHQQPASPFFLSAGNRTRGKRMSTRGIRSALCNYLKRAGLWGRGGVSAHALRYTAARLMKEAGASPDDLKARLRLGTQQTMNMYLSTIATT